MLFCCCSAILDGATSLLKPATRQQGLGSNNVSVGKLERGRYMLRANRFISC